MRPEATLFLLVTCSRDTARRDLAVEVTKNLAQLTAEMDASRRLVVFDNASSYDDHLDCLPPGVVICRSEVNVGYWSAVNWVLNHIRLLADFDCKYLYIVESDLVHSALRPLVVCEKFLEREFSASSVRTQEFSVRARWRYDKRLKWLPFHVVRSQISLRNCVTGESASFSKVSGFDSLYLSNLHAKLPALHRVEALQKVFSVLANMGEFTEADFFREMMVLYPMIGVLDGGLFHALVSWNDRDSVMTGSYSSTDVLNHFGYQATRTATIDLVESRVSVVRI